MYLQLLGMFALCALEYDQDMLSHDHLGKVDNRSYLPTPSASVWGYLLGPATDPSMVSGLVPRRARQCRDLSALWFEAILAQAFATEEAEESLRSVSCLLVLYLLADASPRQNLST